MPVMWLKRSSPNWACSRENVDNKIRYVSAWFDDELTKLEGAE